MHYSKKKLQIKVFRQHIFDKKVCKGICLSLRPPPGGGTVLERKFGSNIKLYRNGKINSRLDRTLPKIGNIPKKASNKSYSPSNFKRKCSRGHMSISPWIRSCGFESHGVNIKLHSNGKLYSFLGRTLPKIRIIPKKGSNKNFLASNCVQKSLQGRMSIYPFQSGAGGLER